MSHVQKTRPDMAGYFSLDPGWLFFSIAKVAGVVKSVENIFERRNNDTQTSGENCC